MAKEKIFAQSNVFTPTKKTFEFEGWIESHNDRLYEHNDIVKLMQEFDDYHNKVSTYASKMFCIAGIVVGVSSVLLTICLIKLIHMFM